MQDPFFFGYGSLVHRATHSYPMAAAAKLHGYRRVWRATTLREFAFLSVERHEHTTIEGLVAQVPNADWVALDEREHAYQRYDVTDQVESEPARSEIQVYSVAPEFYAADGQEYTLLLSYIDVVVQGFLREFGNAGVSRFFDTTVGWPRQILNDRQAPIYPRFQSLSDTELELVDSHLRALEIDV